jgi:hypothetical protein
MLEYVGIIECWLPQFQTCWIHETKTHREMILKSRRMADKPLYLHGFWAASGAAMIYKCWIGSILFFHSGFFVESPKNCFWLPHEWDDDSVWHAQNHEPYPIKTYDLSSCWFHPGNIQIMPKNEGLWLGMAWGLCNFYPWNLNRKWCSGPRHIHLRAGCNPSPFFEHSTNPGNPVCVNVFRIGQDLDILN